MEVNLPYVYHMRKPDEMGGSQVMMHRTDMGMNRHSYSVIGLVVG